jgi:hypothetical protein
MSVLYGFLSIDVLSRSIQTAKVRYILLVFDAILNFVARVD